MLIPYFVWEAIASHISRIKLDGSFHARIENGTIQPQREQSAFSPITHGFLILPQESNAVPYFTKTQFLPTDLCLFWCIIRLKVEGGPPIKSPYFSFFNFINLFKTKSRSWKFNHISSFTSWIGVKKSKRIKRMFATFFHSSSKSLIQFRLSWCKQQAKITFWS